MKGIGRLVSWGTLPTIDNIKRNLDNPDQVTISWRKVDYKEPWILSLAMPNVAEECVTLIIGHLTKQGLTIDKRYDKRKKLSESEVTAQGVKQQQSQIEKLLKTIYQYEQVVETAKSALDGGAEVNYDEDDGAPQLSPATVQHLISLYNKAIEYYSALNDERHIEYLQKLQNLLLDEKMQKILEASDKGAV